MITIHIALYRLYYLQTQVYLAINISRIPKHRTSKTTRESLGGPSQFEPLALHGDRSSQRREWFHINWYFSLGWMGDQITIFKDYIDNSGNGVYRILFHVVFFTFILRLVVSRGCFRSMKWYPISGETPILAILVLVFLDKWWFPKIGVPQVIIHFRIVLCHKPSSVFWVAPWLWKPPNQPWSNPPIFPGAHRVPGGGDGIAHTPG